MPSRVWEIVLGLLGAGLIVALWMSRRDVRAAARGGSRCARLIAAGAVLLAWFGLGAVPASAEPAGDDRGVVEDGSHETGTLSADATGDDPNDAPAPASPAVAAFALRDRLAELKRLIAGEAVGELTIARARERLSAACRPFDDPRYWDRMPAEGRKQVEAMLAEAAPLLTRAGALVEVGACELGESRQWKLAVEAWRFVGPLAKTRKSTAAQRKEATDKLAAAAKALAKLREAGLLSPAEVELLLIDAGYLRQEMFREPPTDSQVMCYDRMAPMPRTNSLQRLEKRTKALATLIEADRVAAPALERALAGVERDLAILAGQARPGDRPDPERVDETRRKTEAFVAGLREKLRSARLSGLKAWREVQAALMMARKLDQADTVGLGEYDHLAKAVDRASQHLRALVEQKRIDAERAQAIESELEKLKNACRIKAVQPGPTCYMIVPELPALKAAPAPKVLERRRGAIDRALGGGRLNGEVVRRRREALDAPRDEA